MSSAALAEIAPQSHLRAELAEGILAVWHKGREQILKIGRLLIEAKDKLGHGNFTQMVLEDMPFSPRQAQTFMEIARSPRISNPKNSSLLPVAVETLKAIDKLSDGEYEAALSHGVIRPNVTEREVREFQRQICQHETVETAEAWSELAERAAKGEQSVKVNLLRRVQAMDEDGAAELLGYLTRDKPSDHRPLATARHAAPSAPEGAAATTLSELVYLLIQRRHAVGLSQAALGEKIGTASRLWSKYEILHQPEGRAPGIEVIFEACQALGVGIALVALG